MGGGLRLPCQSLLRPCQSMNYGDTWCRSQGDRVREDLRRLWCDLAHLDHIGTAAETVLEIEDQLAPVEHRSPGLHIDQKINITVRAGVAARDRAEHTDIACAATRCDALDLSASSTQLIQRGHCFPIR